MDIKKALQSMYSGSCTITEDRKVQDPITKITQFITVEVYKDIPCRLSYKTIYSANSTTTVTTVTQVIKVFMDNKIDVNPGSRITITQNGKTEHFKLSGQPAVFSYHQEIVLELLKDYS